MSCINWDNIFRKAKYFIGGLNENYKNNIRSNNLFL